jgi:branched-chain amino acid transport system substrate-binding protein
MRRSKWWSLLSLLFALMLIAAACADEDDGGDGEGDTGGESASEACDADEFGCVEVADGDPITLGSLLVISGPNAALGTDSERGVRIAMAERGDIEGHSLELVAQDDGCSAEGGQAGAQALATDDQIVGVIGTSCSSAAQGVADRILSERGIVLISPSNTGPDLTAEGTHQPFYLRTAHNDKIQGAVVAQFASDELGAQSMATIHDGSPYAESLQQVAADVFSGDFGGTVTKQEAIQVGETDFNSVLTDIGADEPDILYYPIFVAEGALITSQAKEIDGLQDTTLIASDGVVSPDFFKGAKDAAGSMYISGPDVSVGGDAYTDFTASYEEEFGEAPISAFHAHAYDATNMLLDAIEAVAIVEEGTMYIPRTALKDEMFSTSGFQGITGELTCNETGDCQQQATIAVNEIQDPKACETSLSEEGCSEVVFQETLTLEEAGG